MTDFEFFTKLNGTTFREGVQDYIKKEVKPGDSIVVVPEPENKFDKNALKVMHNGTFVGYIPKETAAKIAKDSIKASVSEVTGGVGDKTFVGCNIKLIVTRGEVEDGEQSKII